MANQFQVDLLKQGAEAWNIWRKENPQISIDLSNADFTIDEYSGHSFYGANLYQANFNKANLAKCNFKEANLIEVDFSNANLEHASFIRANISRLKFPRISLKYNELGDYTFTPPSKFDSTKRAKFSYAKLNNTDFTGLNLIGVDFTGAELENAKFIEANLTFAIFLNAKLNNSIFIGANLYEANFCKAQLRKATLCEALLSKASFSDADLSDASLAEAFLSDTNFDSANLTNANLTGANLYRANLTRSNLSYANLQNTSLVETLINDAIFLSSKVYGISAWSVKGSPLVQKNLIITYERGSSWNSWRNQNYGLNEDLVNQPEPKIMVDDIQIAQFVHLLLNNKNIRNVIDTMTSKAVLILGRFVKERKELLDNIRQELFNYGYVPILFDFENSTNQSLLETVMTLAGMSRFIIADVTSATMVREELRSIVEKYPSKPIQPILLQSEKEYVTLPEIFVGFKSMLPTYVYKTKDEVISLLKDNIITPAEHWLESKKNESLGHNKTKRELELEKEIQELKRILENSELNKR